MWVREYVGKYGAKLPYPHTPIPTHSHTTSEVSTCIIRVSHPGAGTSLQFISKIENSAITNGFHEVDDAAIAVLEILIPLSKATNVEYGGYIYKKDHLFYFTNPPVKGSGITVDIRQAKRLIPEGAEITGDYHTHFTERSAKINAGDETVNRESKWDDNQVATYRVSQKALSLTQPAAPF